MLARSRCRLKWFRLQSVPPAERLAALRMQARAWSPFESTACRLSPQGEIGLVVAWDARQADADLRAAGLAPERCDLVVEPMMRRPLHDGVILQRCLEGFEGQYWRGGVLQASRWWPVGPDLGEWRLFLHTVPGEGLSEVGPALPAVLDLPWLGKPWVSLQGVNGDAQQADGRESRVLLVAGLALAFFAGVVGKQWWDVDQQQRRREAEIAALRDVGGPVLAQRDRALAAAALAQQWSQWLNEPLPIEVIAHLHEMLGKTGSQVRELELAGSTLRLALQLTPQASRSAIVRELQAGGWFKDVAEARVDSQRGLMVLDLRLEGLRAPLRAVAGASIAAAANPVQAPAFPPPSVFSAGGKP